MFELKYARRLAIMLVLAVMLNISATVFTEFKRFDAKQDFVYQAIRQAVDYTRVNLQTVSSAAYTGNSGLQKDKLQQWSKDIRSQASSLGTLTPWLDKSLTKIYDSAGTVTAYTPLNYGLTYIDVNDYETMFRDALARTVEYNFGTHTAPPNGGGFEWDTLYIDDVRVNISGPIVKRVDNSGHVAQSLFGKVDPDTGSSGMDFNYLISYDITVEVDWGSVTTLPLFNHNIGRPRYYSGRPELSGQTILMSQYPVVFKTTYALTN